MPASPIEKKLRVAGLLIVLGLLILAVTLLWAHPLSFIAFLLIGCPVTIAGIAVSLLSLLGG